MSKILILGSNGQIGSYLKSYLLNGGYLVQEFDLTNGSEEDLRVFGNPKLEKLISETDFVFFLAFDVGGSHYIEKYQDSKEFIDNNLQIMFNTFYFLQKYSKRFIFASSQMSNMSQSTYGLLKSVGERYTKALGGRTVKFWNVYGYETNPEKFHAISDFIEMASKKGSINLRTTGQETRDFLYAEDCCKGLEVIMKKYDELSVLEDIHLAAHEWTSILRVAGIVADLFKADVVPGSRQDNVQNYHKNEPRRDFLKLWNPQIKIEEGIKLIVDRYLESSS